MGIHSVFLKSIMLSQSMYTSLAWWHYIPRQNFCQEMSAFSVTLTELVHNKSIVFSPKMHSVTTQNISILRDHTKPHQKFITKWSWATAYTSSSKRKISVLCFDGIFSILGICFERFGKPLVLDMMAVDMFESARKKFDQVQQGLLASVMSKDILKGDRWERK